MNLECKIKKDLKAMKKIPDEAEEKNVRRRLAWVRVQVFESFFWNE